MGQYAEQMVEGIEGKEVPAQIVYKLYMREGQAHALRAGVVDPEIRQASAGRKQVADGDNVVQGVHSGTGCCQ